MMPAQIAAELPGLEEEAQRVQYSIKRVIHRALRAAHRVFPIHFGCGCPFIQRERQAGGRQYPKTEGWFALG
jgi:hypothetical protein